MTNERKLRQALKAIAEITLYGEPVENPFWKARHIETGQYDVDGDHYTPNSDTIASYLEFAVRTARKALGKE